jgi:cobalt-zinc-cadmium efflux system protein
VSAQGHSHRHEHAHARDASQSRLGWTALLTGIFMLAEIAGGLVSGSLALLADAGHMFTDFAALGMAWFAARLSRRPADWKRTYGFDRFAILVAFVNGLSLFVIAGFILFEAVQRMLEPVEILGPVMLSVAIAGLLVNVLAFWILHGADRGNLNVRGAAAHVLGDLLGSVAAILAAGIIMATGWVQADPILSVLVALLILRSAWSVVRDSGHILLESAPSQLDSRQIAADLVAGVEGVEDVHHLHLWSITENRGMVTLHARIRDEAEPGEVIAAIKRYLEQAYGLSHATVEVETTCCADETLSGHAHAH